MNNLTKNLSEHERKKLESIRDKLAKNAETKNVFEALIHNFLQQPHREDFSNFLASLEASGESGLLKVIEEQLDLQGRLLTFDLIKEESISLHDLIE
ncbi:MAG: hypothetical protein LBI53_05725 [Candidatus Peribacteria bacterium]|jgi:hypothetical protein|nr:hypothetical protein [Candidatus Peribacteria bacterium]